MYMVDLIDLPLGRSAEGPTHDFLSPYFQARTHTMGVSFSARGQQNEYRAGYVRIFILWTLERDGAPPPFGVSLGCAPHFLLESSQSSEPLVERG